MLPYLGNNIGSTARRSNGLVYGVLRLRPEFPSLIPSSAKSLSFAKPSLVSDLYIKQGPLLEVPSLRGTRAQPESLRMMHSGKC